MKKSLLLSIVVVLSGTLSAQLKFNHVFDAADFNDPMVCVGSAQTVAFDGTTLLLKEAYSGLFSWGDALNWSSSYMDIALEGAPLNIHFDIAYNTPGKMKLDFLEIFDDGQGYILPTVGSMSQSSDLGNAMFWLAESADGVTYTTTHSWRHSANDVFNLKSSYGFLPKSVRLKETTRFVRLGYRANFQGQYKNIKVTPLHSDIQLDIDPSALDFGRMHTNTTDRTDDKSMELGAYWRNVKDITLEVRKFQSDVAKQMYSVIPTTLGTNEIGTGSGIINVNNHPNAAVGTYQVSKETQTGAYVHIHAATQYANDERIRNIPLSVVLCKDKRTISWYDGQDTVFVGNGVTLDKASISPSGTIKYKTLLTNGTATVNATTFKTSAAPTIGIVQMEAYCDGSGNYADASVVRTFVILPEHGSLYSASLCEGDMIEVGGQTITAVMGKTYEVVTMGGDSTIFVSMSVHSKSDGIAASIKVAEYDMPFKWESKTFTTADSQTDTLHTRYGCDSVVTMTLSVMQTYYKTDTVCQNRFPIYWRHYLGKEGEKDIYDTIHIFNGYESATHVFAGLSGDSAVQYKVVPYDTIRLEPEYRTICHGDSTLWHTQYYKEKGVYYWKDSVNECGTPVICSLNLTVLSPSSAPTVDSTICAVDTANFIWRDKKYVSGQTVYQDTAYYEDGCDSVYYQLNLMVLYPTMLDPVDTAICAVDTAVFEWRDKKYVSGQTEYTDTAYYANGCDSVYYQLNLTVLYPTTLDPVDTAICAVDTAVFEWRDKKYVSGQTEYTDTAYYANGCDSVYCSLKLRVLYPITVPAVDSVICAEDTTDFEWHGHKYITGQSVYKDTAYYQAGCDSVYSELHLSLRYTLPGDTTAAACDSFIWYGEAYTASGDYQHALSTETGCDSIVTLHLTINKSVNIEMSDTTCPAKPYIWEGDTLTASGDYPKTLQTVAGCDSTVTLHLLVETPNPDLYPTLDNVPASNKYNAWLLMLDKAAVEDTYHLTPAQTDVTWYRVVNDIDSQRDNAIKDDEPVGQGFYYTDERSLTGAYYALINVPTTATSDGCGAIYRSMVLNATMAQALMLVPTRVEANGTLQLRNVDNSFTTVRVYSATGQLVNTICSENNHTIEMKAEGSAGMYLIKVQNEQQEQTLKYIVVQ